MPGPALPQEQILCLNVLPPDARPPPSLAGSFSFFGSHHLIIFLLPAPRTSAPGEGVDFILFIASPHCLPEQALPKNMLNE